MSELHSNIYFKHDDPVKHQQLFELFNLGCINSGYYRNGKGDFNTDFFEIASKINPSLGRKVAEKLISDLNDNYEKFSSESTWEVAGYRAFHLVYGSMGDELLGRFVEFLYQLAPDVHAQGWGCGDDDPWEFWFKFEDGKLIRKDDEPEYDEDFKGLTYNNDGEEEYYDIKPIYSWWHKDMPDEIKEGFSNVSDDED